MHARLGIVLTPVVKPTGPNAAIGHDPDEALFVERRRRTTAAEMAGIRRGLTSLLLLSARCPLTPTLLSRGPEVRRLGSGSELGTEWRQR